MTILSVNKTRKMRWALCAHFFMGWVRAAPIFFFLESYMNRKAKFLVNSAVIAAMYVVLTYAQNILFPNSSSMAIQFRASEALCVLAFFTPAAIPGLAIGCLIFNISNAAALPLDFLVGTAASGLAAAAMWLTRKVTIRRYPLLGLLMPAIFNGLLVGWELAHYIGGGFWLNALYVAIGEVAVLLTLGTALYYAIKGRRLERVLFE